MTGMLRRFCLLLLAAGFAHAQTADFAIEHYTLPNGMEVILHPDHKLPVVRVNFRFRVGSKHEPPGRTGLAHLFEHLLFQRHPGEVDYAIDAQRLGATDVNGETASDYTEYYETVPAARLERFLWMESNRFAQLPENLSSERLENQRSVVINEVRQNIENAPYGRVDPLILANTFPVGHPYHHNVEGSYADLRAVTLDDARAFYAEHYTPDQLTLALAGDFDPAQAKAWVKKYFASMTAGDGVVTPPRSIAPLAAPRTVEMVDRVRDEKVYFTWPGPPRASRDAAALAFVENMLTTGKRHLHPALGDSLSLGVSISRYEYQDASMFSIVVTPAAGAAPEAIDAKLLASLSQLARDGPTAEEMERARNSLEFDQIGSLEDIGSVAKAIQDVRLNWGSIDRWKDWMNRYAAVSAEDVKAAVGRWLTTPNHLTLHVRPQTADRDATPPPDRAAAPPFQTEKPYRVPKARSAKLPNGLEILVLERRDIPKVAFEVRFKAGSVHGPAGKAAVASLAAATAGKATTNRDSDAIDREVERLALALHGTAEHDSQAISIQVARKNLDPAFRLFADMVRNPTFSDATIDAQKKDWLDALEKPDASIDNYERYAVEAAFGPGHPLGVTGLGTPASLRTITADEVRQFHARYWKPNVAVLSFAGDITLKEAVALATESLGSWTGTAEVAVTLPPPQPMAGRLFWVDRKGATQTMVAQVVPGIGRGVPDEAALMLASIVLGGASGSRLNRKIRQQDGIAYFAASTLLQYPGAGLWVSFSKVQADRTGAAIQELQTDLRDFGRAKPITAAELAEAKDLIARSLPEAFAGLYSAADTIARGWTQGHADEWQRFADAIEAVTLNEINTIARKYALADKAFFVLIGDREKVEPQLRDLGLGRAVAVR
jgi:zinc protease